MKQKVTYKYANRALTIKYILEECIKYLKQIEEIEGEIDISYPSWKKCRKKSKQQN